MTDSIRAGAPGLGAPTNTPSKTPGSMRPLSSRAPAPPKLAWDQATSSGLSIRVKLIGLMVAMALVIIVPLATYFPSRELDEARANRHERALVYAGLAAHQLRSAVAFSDRETAREVLGALAKDRVIDSVAVYSAAGDLLHGEGKPTELARRAGRISAQKTDVYNLPGRVLGVAPVQALEGARGTVVVELSTHSLTEMRRRLTFGALWVGGAALALGVMLAWLIARSLGQRIEAIAGAASVMSSGNLDHQIEIQGPNDELGLLAHGFNAMSRKVKELVDHIQRTASQESARLERLVTQRTDQLNTKNRDLRLVLDNVEQGFVTIDRSAHVVGEYSRIIQTWLGAVDQKTSLWSMLTRKDPQLGLSFEVSWEQVLENLMPIEATLDQMPRRLLVDGRHLSLEYRPLGEEPFERMLVVITDVSAAVAREASEQEGRDLVNVTTRLMRSRRDFMEFFDESERLLESVLGNRDDSAKLKRDLHTLKGNSALYGLMVVSAACHELENALESAPAATLDCTRLSAAWQQCRVTVQRLVGEGDDAKIEVSEAEYEGLLSAIQGNATRSDIAQSLRTWRLEPLRARLERVAEQLVSTVQRLGKGKTKVDVRVADLYLGREELHEFWSAFSHVVRNAAVHGLADEGSRVPRAGSDFQLLAGLESERLFVQLADHGPGIDWERVRERAREKGIAHTTQIELEEALFADGISTREDVDEEAGRGVGLSAVRAACLRSQGKVEVETRRGSGTSFRFSWPASVFATLVQKVPV
jgi:two-component system, chemotaxis family, sensor kinase CheA